MRSPLRTLVGRVIGPAAPPVPYSGRSSRLSIPWIQPSGAEAQMRAMGSVGTLFAIVNRTSNATSQIRWHLWRKARSGLASDRTEVTAHAALDLWNRPNPFMTGQEFVEAFMQHLDLTGEGWWVVGRHARASLPLELWPVRPDRMVPVPDPERFLSGYVYVGPEGERVPLGLDEVIQLRMPSPLDPYRGMGPVQSILTDLDSTRYSAEWNRNFFRNSAEPGGVVEIDTHLGDTEFDEFQARWAEQHQGVSNAHRVALLERGARWVERRYTMRDMQFVELRDVAREVIREAFGFPKSMLGATDDVNRANAEAGEVMFARWLIVPRLERIKQALNAELLPLFGDGARELEFDYENPVPDDVEVESAERTSRATSAATLVAAGWEPAAVLSAVGLPEMPYLGRPTAPPPVAGPASRPVPAARVRRRLVRAAADPEQAEVREDWETRLDALLEDWEEISEAQRAELAEQVEALVDAGDVEGIAALAASSSDGAALLEAVLVEQAEAAGDRMVETAAEQGVSIAAAAVAGVLAADLAQGAAATAALLAAGLAVAAGREALRVWAPDSTGEQVAERVTAYLEGLSDATLRAELGGAIWGAEGAGRFATLAQAEADGDGADWFEASEIRDRNTCELCAEEDGTRFDALADAQAAYPNGGYWRCLGGIRCRGTIEPYWGGS